MRVLFFLLLPFSLFSETIHVPLAAHLSFRKTYIRCEQKEFKNLISLDINRNGFCTTTDSEKEADLLIDVSIDKELFFAATDLTTSKKFQIHLPLQKEVAKQLHQCTDKLSLELFGISGIASKKILSTSRVSDKHALICLDSSGSKKTLWTQNSILVTPKFFPHSLLFFVVSYADGIPKICLSSLLEPQVKRVTYLDGNQLMPTITQKLNRIAFICDASGREDLYIQDYSPTTGVQNKALCLFSKKNCTQGSPTFHPDGEKLALVSNKDGSPRIYLLDIGKLRSDGTFTLLTKKNRENTSPDWSPDGLKILYSAITAGTRQIWMVDLATQNEIQLTFDPGHKENPAWGSNSFHFLYNRCLQTHAELYMMNLREKKPVKLSAEDARFPTWEQ